MPPSNHKALVGVVDMAHTGYKTCKSEGLAGTKDPGGHLHINEATCTSERCHTWDNRRLITHSSAEEQGDAGTERKGSLSDWSLVPLIKNAWFLTSVASFVVRQNQK